MKISSFCAVALWALPFYGSAAAVNNDQQQVEEPAAAAAECKPIQVAASGSCSTLKDIPSIEIYASNSTVVTVFVKQSFIKRRPLDWIGIESQGVGNLDAICAEHDGGVPFGAILMGKDALTCDPVTKSARVAIYLADEQFASSPEAAFQEHNCDLGQYEHLVASSKVCELIYDVPCGCKPNVVEVEVDPAMLDHPQVTVSEMENVNTKRKLDAELGEEPSDEPTFSPTASPTDRPSASPTNSFSPTINYPSGPGCDGIATPEDFEGDGPLPFCYNGNGGGGRGSSLRHVTCYAMEQSENCGVMDFLIEGISEVDFLRCSDVWLWFTTCVDSFGCRDASYNAHFQYGAPSRRVIDRSWKDVPEYEFRVAGNGVSGNFRWICDNIRDAYGMQGFFDAVYNQAVAQNGGKSMFATPVGTCDSEAPSVSHSPTQSPAPTMPQSIPCKEELGLIFPFRKPPAGNYVSHGFGWSGTGYTMVADQDCNYKMTTGGVTTTYPMPLDLVDAVAAIFGGTRVENGSELDGEYQVDRNSMVARKRNNQWYAVFPESTSRGVLNADMEFTFSTEWIAITFINQIKQFFKNRGYLWQTIDETNRCGSSPLCYSEKPYATCYATRDSENCGEWDFIVASHNEVFHRSANGFDFFNACLDTNPDCYPHPNQQWVGGRPTYTGSRIGTMEWVSDDRIAIVVGATGMTKQNRYICDGMENAEYFRDFTMEMIKSGLFTQKSECTESPTEAPTACTDGFLTKPPINIVIAIDISFSTYELSFHGSEVGDLNGDEKLDTILDAEIAAVLRLLRTIQHSDELNNDNVNLGLVIFESEATYKGEYMPLGQYKPLTNDGLEINPQLVTDLKSLKTKTHQNYAVRSNVGFTNFDDALDKTILYFEERESELGDEFDDWTNLLVFLSDGVPTVRGDGDNEQPCNLNTTCSDAAAPGNAADSETTNPWETGALSYCFSGDESCWLNEYKNCVSGPACSNAPQTMDFTSEFARLDQFGTNGVMRLAIGVGAESDVSKESALYMIDNNPYKEQFDLLPPQALTADDLSNVLRNLCFESTSNPTDTPSVNPTYTPTVSPTSNPTRLPTSAPTRTPSDMPTSEPTFAPTVDICEYHVIDFSTTANGDPTGDGLVAPSTWAVFGMRILTNSMAGIKHARYFDTQDPEAGKGIIVQAQGTNAATMSTTGGQIIITLDMTHDKTMKLSLFGTSSGYSITKVMPPKSADEQGERSEAFYPGSEGGEEIQVNVNGVYQIIIGLEGPGALTEMKVCRNPDNTPAPIGLASNGDTDAPTQSPTSICPPGVTLLNKQGGTPYDSLPIEVVNYGESTVTFKVKNTVVTTAQYMYTSYKADDFSIDCVMLENVESTVEETITAHCMKMAQIAIVDVFVSDSQLSTELDDATIPRCCQRPSIDTNPVVHYTFEVMCANPCPSETPNASRKLLRSAK